MCSGLESCIRLAIGGMHSLVSEQTMESGTESQKISPAPEVEIKRGRFALGTGL
jgi:hypothetical protein